MKTLTNRPVLRLSVAALLLCSLLALPVSAERAASADLSSELTVLEKLGFHVFPSPVALEPFRVAALAGGKLESKSLEGKIVLFNFWATWCPPCKREMPSIETLWKSLKNEPFTILAVSTGEKQKTVAKFIAENAYSFPIYLDESSALGRLYATQGIPTTYLLNKQGLAIAGVVGSVDYANPELLKALKSMAAK